MEQVSTRLHNPGECSVRVVEELTDFWNLAERSNNSSGPELLHSTYCGSIKIKAEYRRTNNDVFKKDLGLIIFYFLTNLLKASVPKRKNIQIRCFPPYSGRIWLCPNLSTPINDNFPAYCIPNFIIIITSRNYVLFIRL